MAAMNKYPYEQRVKTYLEAIHTFGEEYQEEVAVEEMAELTKEICKNWRGKDNRAAIAEEIADVTIMLEQLRIIFERCGARLYGCENRKAAHADSGTLVPSSVNRYNCLGEEGG